MIILTDIDHTISDARWRDHMIPAAEASGNWDEYFAESVKDQPLAIMIQIVRYFSHMPLYDVIALTGRNRKWETTTRSWLRMQGVRCKEILMRPDGDRTPSPQLKLRLIEERFPDPKQVTVIFEDRDDCVAAFKRAGFHTIQFHDGRGESYAEKKTA